MAAKPVSINSNNKSYDLKWVTGSALLENGNLYIEHFTLVMQLGSWKIVDGFVDRNEAIEGNLIGCGTEFECDALIRILVANSVKQLEPQDIHPGLDNFTHDLFNSALEILKSGKSVNVAKSFNESVIRSLKKEEDK